MYLTLEECRRAWDKAGGHGDKEERIKRNTKWAAYYRYLASEQLDSRAEISSHAAAVATQLYDAGFLDNQSTVLDIGAGTGRYSFAFAGKGAQVSALDMDAASLSVLEQHAGQLGLPGIRCVQSMWEEYEPDCSFSLVFSSMCPAICNYEELLKMESISENACCLIAVTRGSYDLHRKKLMELMDVKPSGGMTTDALWYYNMLYLMNRQPDVKNFSMQAEYSIPTEEVCHRNEIYFQIFGIPSEESRPVLKCYFESEAVNGLVHDETHLNTAVITWKVPGGRSYDTSKIF